MKLENLLKQNKAHDTFDFEQYILRRSNFAQLMYAEAQRDPAMPKISYDKFMHEYYFKKGYDHEYTHYYLGQRHKPKWGEL